MSVSSCKIIPLVLASWILLATNQLAFLSNITDEREVLTVCPGELVSLTCSHDNVNGEQSRWEISGAMSCNGLVSHTTGFAEYTCGQFTITMVSNNTGPTVSSTIQIPVTEVLNGTLIECLAGGLFSSPLVGNTTLNVIDINALPVTAWVANLRTNSLCPVLEWDPLDAPYQRCVTGYTINLNGTVYNTTNTSLSLAGERLPYYETVTVTPLTINGLLSSDTSNITVINPDLWTPALSASFIIQNEALKLQIVFQEISIVIAPIRMFGYITSGEDCVPTTLFNGSSVVIDFSDQSPGDAYTLCVMFRNKECSAFNSTTVTVPATMITVQEITPSDTNYTVRLSLPFTGYPPSDLLIVSTLSPPHSDPITLLFPYTTNQITVTFTDITAGVFYTYTIRVVLASNQSNDVVFPVTGNFILALHVLGESVRSLSTGEAVAVSVAATFTISIAIGLLLGMSVMYCIMYFRNKGRYTVRQRQEESIQPTVPSGPVYEEVTPIQDGIELKLNDAYGPLS
ncbi:uncharacterized protein LOC135348446 isoform X2 [Halichondria panicea]|uniref:uncharacterized protein LOC135348446 isoform X2 n=1 Tax=Halichondria panicea TaxID=6063 RepID=UPI00312B851C